MLNVGKKQLISKIHEWFKNYSEVGSGCCFIEDKKGTKVGKINISKFFDTEERKYLLFQQNFERLTEWTYEELQTQIQGVVNRKEEKYANNVIPKNHNSNKWWFLISDINGRMGTQNADFDLSNLEIRSSYFSRIFLIQDIVTKHRVIELKVNQFYKGKRKMGTGLEL